MELAVGLLIALAVTVARMPLEPLLGQRAPYALVYVGVVFACVLAGWRSGLITLTIGQLLAMYIVVEPARSLAIRDLHEIAAFLFATASQLVILAVIASYQREVSRALADQESQMDLLSEALREIDHRTKNNYQTVVALIMLQAQRALQPEVKQALQDAADRINAVSLASDQLALRSEDLGTVRFGDHLRELCAQIRRGLSRDGVQVQCDVANLRASAEKAIYISIIVNELVTNALKHAFHDDADGETWVSSTEVPDGVSIIFEDNGSGMSASMARSRSGLGTRLVERFVKQAGAMHHVSSSPAGTIHNILVPNLD